MAPHSSCSESDYSMSAVMNAASLAVSLCRSCIHSGHAKTDLALVCRQTRADVSDGCQVARGPGLFSVHIALTQQKVRGPCAWPKAVLSWHLVATEE